MTDGRQAGKREKKEVVVKGVGFREQKRKRQPERQVNRAKKEG